MPRESCNLTIQPAKIQTGCAMFLANEIPRVVAITR